jgi:CheY-like chemotaxis protein
MMGGAIGAESRYGLGSTFWFTVRLGRATQMRTQLELSGQLAGVHALVVEDNPTNRGMLVHQLSGVGMKVSAAEHGSRALELILEAEQNGKPFALALVDNKMPRMNGMELVGAVHGEYGLDRPRIIMLTSTDDPGEASRARALGVAAHVVKPVRQAELLKAIGKVLGSTRTPRPRPGDQNKQGPAVKVLLVEDDAINGEIAAAMLRRLGCEVVRAVNGREGADRALRGGIDLVLMDCQMPELDGYDATRAIRKAEEARGESRDGAARSRMPIVALTANAMQGDRERCIDAGMNDYLSKPFSQAEIGAVVERWSRPAAAPARETAKP